VAVLGQLVSAQYPAVHFFLAYYHLFWDVLAAAGVSEIVSINSSSVREYCLDVVDTGR
jgi:hypothetical protein